MQKITPCLWFDSNAEEAATFYTSVFPNSRIVRVTHYGDAVAEASGRPAGAVMTVLFELDGQPFIALNGGPGITFSQAISFMVDCATQEEVDHLWAKLTEGGAPNVCGWLRDKYGVSWQITPTVLVELLGSEDAARRDRAMEAMLQMQKLDVARLEKAAGQG